jgi:stalled ribosome alternative rescue factor ArfA
MKKKVVRRNPIVAAMIRTTRQKVVKAKRGKGAYSRKERKRDR